MRQINKDLGTVEARGRAEKKNLLSAEMAAAAQLILEVKTVMNAI